MASNSTRDASVPSEQDTPMDDSISFDGNIQSAQKKTPNSDNLNAFHQITLGLYENTQMKSEFLL